MRRHTTRPTFNVAYLTGAVIALSACGGGPPDVPTRHQGAINDTGVSTCINSSLEEIACQGRDVQSELYGQDANFGRDARARAGDLEKIGGGSAGFDFSKLDSSGTVLAQQSRQWSDAGSETAGTRWSCVTDHVTGLTWEIKSNDATSMRHNDLTLSWYNADAEENGGDAGERGVTQCNGLVTCDTMAYLEALNTERLCGRSSWRLPQVTELLSIADQSQINPPLDTAYFPHASYNAHWTSQTVATDPSQAWYVYFTAAGNGSINKTGRAHIRAVSSDQ